MPSKKLRKSISADVGLTLDRIHLILKGQVHQEVSTGRRPPISKHSKQYTRFERNPVDRTKFEDRLIAQSNYPLSRASVTNNVARRVLLFTLPTELSHLIADNLDLSSLYQLICTCRTSSQIYMLVFHKRCGLQPTRLDPLKLQRNSEKPLAMFQAFQSYCRLYSPDWIPAIFTERVDEAVQFCLDGLSILKPNSIGLIQLHFIEPFVASHHLLWELVSAAQRLRVQRLHITYPFPTTIPCTIRPSSSWDVAQLRLETDFSGTLYRDLLHSTASNLKDLSLVHERASFSWVSEPEKTPEPWVWTDDTPLQTLRFPHLTSLTISTNVPPLLIARFTHHHPTLDELKIIHTASGDSAPTCSEEMSIAQVYARSLKTLAGPPEYLKIFLGFCVDLSINWLTLTLSETLLEEKGWHYFEETLVCLSRCGNVRSLEVGLPDRFSDTCLEGLAADSNLLAANSSVRTFRLTSSSYRMALSNDLVVMIFRYWRKILPNAYDLQFVEKTETATRQELLRLIDSEGGSKVSVKSQGLIYRSDISHTPYNQSDWSLFD